VIEVRVKASKLNVKIGSAVSVGDVSNMVNDKAEHWIITNNGGAISSYRNNVADDTGTGSATRTDTASGKHISADGESLNGHLGEFVITTDVITSAERASLAGGGSASALDNKVLYYPFTTNFEDESGNSYDGTATGNPVTTIDTTVGFPTGSNLPETTLFVETDTKLTWWLQDGVWIRNGKNVTTGSAITVSNQSSASNVTEVATNYIWSAGTDSNYGAGYATGCGNKNNFIFCGGNNSATSSQYLNGTAWTTISMGSSERKDTGAGAGTATQAIIAGGRNQAGSFMTTNLTWNGSAWTESSSLLSSGHGEHCSGDGNYSDLLVAGGYTSALQVAIVSIWNGTSFASGTSINTASYGANCGGLSSSAIHMTGGAPASANNESNFNGTSWTATSVSIPFAGRHYFSGGGKQDDHLVIGGYSNVTASHTNKTDLWNGTAWVSKDNLSSTRYASAGDVSGGTVEG